MVRCAPPCGWRPRHARPTALGLHFGPSRLEGRCPQLPKHHDGQLVVGVMRASRAVVVVDGPQPTRTSPQGKLFQRRSTTCQQSRPTSLRAQPGTLDDQRPLLALSRMWPQTCPQWKGTMIRSMPLCRQYTCTGRGRCVSRRRLVLAVGMDVAHPPRWSLGVAVVPAGLQTSASSPGGSWIERRNSIPLRCRCRCVCVCVCV